MNNFNLDLWNRSSRILSGTGHRPHKLGQEYDLRGPYSQFLEQKILECFKLLNIKKIISGMALGFDQLLSLMAIKHGIPVLAAIPCDGQETIWPLESQNLYYDILKNPKVTSKVICPGPYHPRKMIVRDHWMVNNGDALLAAWDGSSGGTGTTVKYAQSQNKMIYRIDPRDCQGNK